MVRDNSLKPKNKDSKSRVVENYIKIKETSVSPSPIFTTKGEKSNFGVKDKKSMKISFDTSVKNSGYNFFATAAKEAFTQKSLNFSNNKIKPNKSFLNSGKVSPPKNSVANNSSNGHLNIKVKSLKVGNDKVVLKSSLYNQYKNMIRKGEKSASNNCLGRSSNVGNHSESQLNKSLLKKNSHSFFHMGTGKSMQFEESERLAKRNEISSENSNGGMKINETNTLKQTSGAEENISTLKKESSVSVKFSQPEKKKSEEIPYTGKNRGAVESSLSNKLSNKQVSFNVSNTNSQEIKIKFENNSLKQFLDVSQDFLEKPSSDSSRISTKKSEETTDKNTFKNNEHILPRKFTKKNINYTNDFNLEDVEENLKSIIFKKNH